MGKGRQWYLGKAAETREPVTGRSLGCLSGPGGRRQRGPQEGRWSLSARSRAASSGRDPAAPGHHKQQWGLVRVRLRLQHGWCPRPTLFPAHGIEAKRQQELLVALPSSLCRSLQMSRAMGSFFPAAPYHTASAGKH